MERRDLTPLPFSRSNGKRRQKNTGRKKHNKLKNNNNEKNINKK